jgi:hypothetical protein
LYTDTKFIVDKDGHASILSDDGVSSNHPNANFCPFCQQHFPEGSHHDTSNLHLKNVQILQAWESSNVQLECWATLIGTLLNSISSPIQSFLQGRLVPDSKLPKFQDEEEASKHAKQFVNTINHLYHLPCVYMVLTAMIMMSMWWVGLVLSFFKQTWRGLQNTTTPFLEFRTLRRNKKPPDPFSAFVKDFSNERKR